MRGWSKGAPWQRGWPGQHVCGTRYRMELFLGHQPHQGEPTRSDQVSVSASDGRTEGLLYSQE